MKLLNQLERKFRDYAIPHVTITLILFQSFTYLVSLVHPEYIERLFLTHDDLFAGEWWRLLTVLLIPPSTGPQFLIFFLFWMQLFYMYGIALEQQWGTFRYNLYLLIGYLLTLLVALIPEARVSNVYLIGSIFLAFAWLYPEYPLQLFFIFPVQVKWLGLLAWIVYAFRFFAGGLPVKAEIAAGVANFVIFFHADLWDALRTRQRKFKSGMAQAAAREAATQPMHVCAACGVTDQSDRKMEFRYCPQCTGTPAYCINHIQNHVHK
jgi:hypothetical protein